MPHANFSVSINRPVDAVFAFVADGENARQWRSGVLDIARVAGSPDGVGARYAQGVKGPMGRRIAADYEVTVFEPNRRIEFQAISGPARPHGRYDFEPSGDGTSVTFALDAELRGLRGLLLGSAVQRTMEAEVRTLEALKRLLEA